MAGVTRQAVSAVESGHSDPSLRVALALAQALGMTVEELFGPGDLAQPVPAVPVAPLMGQARVALAPAGGLAITTAGPAVPAAPGASVPAARAGTIAVRPIGPPRPTLVVAGCDPALPLLTTPLGLLDPPVGFAWWPCGSQEALRLAAAGLAHVAVVHLSDSEGGYNPAADGLPGGAEVVGFTAWREGLAIRPELAGTITGLDGIAKHRLRLVNR